MSAATVIVEGVVKPDGTLELPRKLDLPAGRVQVTVQSVTESTQPDRFWKMMESLWAELRAGGRTPRTREEIDTEISALRNEMEEEMQAVERLQEECRRAREQAREAKEPPR
jgi:predicted RNase H-like nuclease (RuvC/YqgF family)